ncbi:unnamed protein product [Notodromas monacha]|uniref:Pasha n=1 Tax=Notodromas monacha TaxID=399045 RepID=A0A7R9G9M3_9CRUS|nr:unnamed protein product [Notodromas monacha]CAG0913366.1 unnamed protein product [Notodromas monacha]
MDARVPRRDDRNGRMDVKRVKGEGGKMPDSKSFPTSRTSSVPLRHWADSNAKPKNELCYVGNVVKPFQLPMVGSSREFSVLDEVRDEDVSKLSSKDSSSGSSSSSSTSSDSSSSSSNESSSDSDSDDEDESVETWPVKEEEEEDEEEEDKDPEPVVNDVVVGRASATTITTAASIPVKHEKTRGPLGEVLNYAEKYSLLEKGQNEFEFLPSGWIKLNHSSGLPVFLHQESRVCTWSQPYFIGNGSVRRHEVPLSSIPCFKYLREQEKEQFRVPPGIIDLTDKKVHAVEPKVEEPVVDEVSPLVAVAAPLCPAHAAEPEREDGEVIDDVPEAAEASEPVSIAASHAEPGNRIVIQNAQLITAAECEKSELLGAEAIREYATRRFTLHKRSIAVFDSWRSRRVYKKVNNRTLNGPEVPKDAKLITLPILTPGLAKNGDGKTGQRRHRIFNPAGKSYVSILHEVLFFSQQSYPEYKYLELTDAASPYAATVMIQGVEYGTGYGSSKRLAKVNAAKATLGILLPDCKKELKIDDEPGKSEDGSETVKDDDATDASGKNFFDSVDIEDSRVAKMSNTLGKPPPFQILTTCIQRNHGLGAFNVETKLDKQPNRKLIEFTMKVANHEVTVKCKNKREGKQVASQMILKKLHPLLGSWGALLRLYGVSPSEAAQRKHKLAQEVTKLQQKQAGQAKGRSMNLALLKKLREEMAKLKDSRSTLEPIGRIG